MALASPLQPTVTVQQLTPPSSSHGGRGSWDFAVPLNDTKIYTDQKPFMSEDVPSTQHRLPRQPLASQPNGTYKTPHSNTLDSQRQNYEDDPAYLVPNQVNQLQKKGSDITTNGSDPDSVLDYYKTDGKNGARNAPHTALGKDRKKKTATKWVEVEKDDSNWIHRDKLKEIESRELEEAGFRVGRASRSNSRSQSATRNRDRQDSEATDRSHSSEERQDHRRMVSPIPAEEEEVEDGPAQWDLRTPEEIAAEQEQCSTPRTTHVLRPSTSRIPVAKTSPMPVPHTYVDRDAPLPRSRKGSAAWSGDAIAVNGARVRSGSTSSQVLLDDLKATDEAFYTPSQGNFSNPTSPVTNSPPRSPQKAKMPGKAAPTSGARKTSTQKSGSQPKRNTSTTSPMKRPGTSGGSISRPSTSHRPEGEAPWLATMYKPDPRLPPDQQIIPTHAKRMQQEQWETEGKTGSIYDREFRLLNTEEFKDRRASQTLQLDLEKQDDEQWPLPSPTKASPEDTNVKSPTEQGGYKLTPTIPQSPRTPSRAASRAELRPAPTTSPKPAVIRLPEPQAEEEKEKKGCCCIVM